MRPRRRRRRSRRASTACCSPTRWSRRRPMADAPLARPERAAAPVATADIGVVEKPLSVWERLSNIAALRKLALLVALAVAWELYARVLAEPLLVPTFFDTLEAFWRGIAS